MPLTRDQARRVDQLAIAAGLPGIVLMENAAINAVAVILDQLDATCGVKPADARVSLVCGGGNNGGDGYAIARHLANWGCAVTLFAATDPDQLRGDAAINHRVCRNFGLPIRPCHAADSLAAAATTWNESHLVVDALLGTGFVGEMRPHVAAIIRTLNTLDRPVVVAIDVPSGLDCDTGKPSPATVRADVTVTFVDAKAGFTHEAARAVLGRVVVADIGVSAAIVRQARAGS